MSQLHKPPNYDNSEIQRTPPPEGGYVMEVHNVQKLISYNGGVYLRFLLDISEGLFTGYYKHKLLEERNQSKKGIAKWKCCWNVFIDSKDWENTKYCFEESNYRCKMDDLVADPSRMKGLKVGAVLSKEVLKPKGTNSTYIRLVVTDIIPIDKVRNGEFVVGIYFKEEQRRRRNNLYNKGRWGND